MVIGNQVIDDVHIFGFRLEQERFRRRSEYAAVVHVDVVVP